MISPNILALGKSKILCPHQPNKLIFSLFCLLSSHLEERPGKDATPPAIRGLPAKIKDLPDLDALHTAKQTYLSDLEREYRRLKRDERGKKMEAAIECRQYEEIKSLSFRSLKPRISGEYEGLPEKEEHEYLLALNECETLKS